MHSGLPLGLSPACRATRQTNYVSSAMYAEYAHAKGDCTVERCRLMILYLPSWSFIPALASKSSVPKLPLPIPDIAMVRRSWDVQAGSKEASDCQPASSLMLQSSPGVAEKEVSTLVTTVHIGAKSLTLLQPKDAYQRVSEPRSSIGPELTVTLWPLHDGRNDGNEMGCRGKHISTRAAPSTDYHSCVGHIPTQ